jgi:hypothetical protein
MISTIRANSRQEGHPVGAADIGISGGAIGKMKPGNPWNKSNKVRPA